MERITLKQVAAEAGISISCTARALKGRPGISSTTRFRVREIAERLGYRPDPMLSALATYREANRQTSFQGTLAYLATNKDEQSCLSIPETGDLLRGVKKRADQLGYQVEYFTLVQSGLEHSRLWKNLKARGVCGAVMRSFPLSQKIVLSPEYGISCIDLFGQPYSEILPTVSSYHSQSMELALNKLLERGVRRPGLVIDLKISNLLHHGWLMVFGVYANQFQKTFLFEHQGCPSKSSVLADWITASRLDAVIFCTSENMMPKKSLVANWLRKDISVISMDLLNPEGGIMGIYQDRFRAGVAAVTQLHGMIITGKLELETHNNSIQIPGVWKECLLSGPRPGSKSLIF